VLSEGVTAKETEILHDNVLSGTATRSAIDCPTAAKTGTTSELVDAWLDGYTPNYATVVWMGYPNKRVSMTDVHGEPQQGGYLPAEIWHDYMAAATEGQPCAEFPQPKEPIAYQPFFGHYATLGHSGGGEHTGEEPLYYEHERTSPSQLGQHHHESSPNHESGAHREHRETPEQAVPEVQTPKEPATPAPTPETPAHSTPPAEKPAEKQAPAEPEKHAPAAEPAPTGGAEPHP